MSVTAQQDSKRQTRPNKNKPERSSEQELLQVNKTLNELKKTILKLTFAWQGIDPQLDKSITNLKSQLTAAEDETEKRSVILQASTGIIEQIHNIKQTQLDSTGDRYFTEFLQRLSILSDKKKQVTELRQRCEEIKQEQDYLQLIDETVQLLQLGSGDSDDELKLLTLIENLQLPEKEARTLLIVRNKITSGQDCEFYDLCEQISAVVNEALQTLRSELSDVREYLNQLIPQLSVLYGHIQSTLREQNISCNDTLALQGNIAEKNTKIKSEITNTDDLESLKSMIHSHLQKIETSINEHAESEKRRKTENEKRISNLKTQLETIEGETLELKVKLNQECENAQRDMLTTLPNRLAYEEQIKKEIAAARRYQKPMTMAVIDIDNFKKVNDHFGHKAGDKVLKAVANVCRENIRDADFLSRYGGEEFVLLLPETDVEEAAIAVENLRRVVESCNFYHQSQTVLITISVGYAELNEDDNADSLFERADQALYAAKNNGRNRCMSDQQLPNAA